jgi:hypothetical protein
MRTLGFIPHALSASVAAALLTAGCAKLPPQDGMPGLIPQSRSVARQGERISWMLPGSSSGALIYAVDGCGGTCVVSYPAGNLVGSLTTSGSAICSDSSGNVFIPENSTVTEYAHGATSPTATLSLPGYSADGCSVDPQSNNLAVVFGSSEGNVAIFANEQGIPAVYSSGIDSLYCGYDGKGNLFVDGYKEPYNGLAELPKGSATFTVLSITDLPGTPGQVQWDGKYITYQDRSPQNTTISRLAISGSVASIVGTTTFSGIRHRSSQSWLYGSNVLIPYYVRGKRANIIGIWSYPKGGKVKQAIRRFGSYRKRTINFQGVTLSVGS